MSAAGKAKAAERCIHANCAAPQVVGYWCAPCAEHEARIFPAARCDGCTLASTVRRAARVTSDGTYRYWLVRQWSDAPLLAICGLNPSIADAEIDDPTIRREVNFARREGCGGLIKVNMFGFRATDPAELARKNRDIDIIGNENDAAILSAMKGDREDEAGNRLDAPKLAIVAWGTGGTLLDRDLDVIELLGTHNVPMHCFGVTKDGHPRHPLYLPNDAAIVPFVPRSRTATRVERAP